MTNRLHPSETITWWWTFFCFPQLNFLYSFSSFILYFFLSLWASWSQTEQILQSDWSNPLQHAESSCWSIFTNELAAIINLFPFLHFQWQLINASSSQNASFKGQRKLPWVNSIECFEVARVCLILFVPCC